MLRISSLVILAFISSSIAAQNKNVTNDNKGKIEFLYSFWDFGNINEMGGNVNHEFKFVNTGKAPVKISDIKTTCGCTSTKYTLNEVKPGDTGSVFADFDPVGKQGPFEKTISIISNGSPSLIDLTIRGVVYATKLKQNNPYIYRYGNLAVANNVIELSKVKHNSYDSVDIGFFNLGNKKIYFYKIETPSNIQVIRPYDNVQPNSEYKLKLRYFPKRPLEFGPIRQEIKVYTNDDTLPVKVFAINANIIEDFGTLDKKALKESPKVYVKNNTIDLGIVKLFSSPSGEFEIKNKGKKDLEIRRIIKGCTCLSPEISASTIKKGETAKLKVTWSNVNMSGPDSKTIKLLTNDPTQPEIILILKVNSIE